MAASIPASGPTKVPSSTTAPTCRRGDNDAGRGGGRGEGGGDDGGGAVTASGPGADGAGGSGGGAALAEAAGGAASGSIIKASSKAVASASDWHVAARKVRRAWWPSLSVRTSARKRSLASRTTTTRASTSGPVLVEARSKVAIAASMSAAAGQVGGAAQCTVTGADDGVSRCVRRLARDRSRRASRREPHRRAPAWRRHATPDCPS